MTMDSSDTLFAVNPIPDELPSYSPPAESAPAYSRQDDSAAAQELDRRALVFSLRQVNRKRQKFISMGPAQLVMRGSDHFSELATNLTMGHHDSEPPFPWYSTNREYEINHLSGAGLSRTKPDMTVTAVGRQAHRQSSVPPPPRRKSFFRSMTSSPVNEDTPRPGSEQLNPQPKQQPVASIRFMRSGPLPWTPRAQINYADSFVNAFGHDDPNVVQKHDMSLQRSLSHGWTFEMFGRKHAWNLASMPTRLELVDLESESRLGTFTYSKMGSLANRDGEVGRLKVPLQRAPGSSELDGVDVRGGMQDGLMEWIIASLIVAVTHWKNECKILVN